VFFHIYLAHCCIHRYVAWKTNFLLCITLLLCIKIPARFCFYILHICVIGHLNQCFGFWMTCNSWWCIYRVFVFLICRELLIDFYTSSGNRKPDNIIIFRLTFFPNFLPFIFFNLFFYMNIINPIIGSLYLLGCFIVFDGVCDPSVIPLNWISFCIWM
jgi:hypothetical protein